MKSKRLILVGIVAAITITLLTLGRKSWRRYTRQVFATHTTATNSSARSTTTPVIEPAAEAQPALSEAQVDKRRRVVEFVQSIYNTPIVFYGRVQDQHERSVPGATVHYSIIDKFFAPGSAKTDIADERGYFSLTDVRGAALTVGVSKEGYDPIYQQSNGAFSFGMPYDAQRDRPPPTKDKPTVFVLRKKALAEPLFAIHGDVIVPKDGTSVEVSLKTGKAVETGRGDLKIETWTSDRAKDARGRYEWRCRLSVPGGGLLVRTEREFRFAAPESGYQPSIEFHMPQTAERWQEDHDDEYWLKLGNQTYARMRLRITTGGAHFVSITSYLNPSGSPNLEYDENKIIK